MRCDLPNPMPRLAKRAAATLLLALVADCPGQTPRGAAAVTDDQPRIEHDRVILGRARFSLLDAGIVRLEYAPDGRFDDRPTFRAISLPAPRPFSNVAFANGELVLSTADAGARIEVRYRPPERFTPETLGIRWSAGGLTGTWSPGDLDPQNLGGVMTLDHANRALMPRGVHPAGLPHVERYGELNLAATSGQAQAEAVRDPTFDARLLKSPPILEQFELLPPHVQALFDWCRKAPPGAVSRAGYTVLDETGMAAYDPAGDWIDRAVRPDYQNLFFTCYGRDYAAAMQRYVLLCGRIPLLPRWAFGTWYSCFEKLSADDNRRLVADFDRHGIPLSVLIVDMDWHVNGWNGWDWSAERFPDPTAFLADMRTAGIRVALNLHCDSINRGDSHFKELCRRLGVAEDVADPPHLRYFHEPGSWTLDFAERRIWEAVRDVCFVPNEQRGVHFWWLDNWQGRQEGYNSVLWLNHLVWRHMEQTRGMRPITLGRCSGVGSHRYPAYFSGDTASQWEVLHAELEVNVRAGQVGMNYFSHDLGGFKGPMPGHVLPLIDPELYVRWMQMGALSPVMRMHSDHGTREPWKYGAQVLELTRPAFELHARLVPYLYHLAREAYDRGAPIHRPMYFVTPEDPAAYDILDQYFIGKRILAAPVATAGGRRRVVLPAGDFYALPEGDLLRGPLALERVFPLELIPLYVRAGSIIPQQDPAARVASGAADPLVLAVYPGGDDGLALYEDDGDSNAYRDGAFSRRPITLRDDGRTIEVRLDPAVGSYAGQPARRTIRVEVHFIERPARVEIDGVTAPAWAYDDARRVVVVPLEGVANDAGVTVAVRRTE